MRFSRLLCAATVVAILCCAALGAQKDDLKSRQAACFARLKKLVGDWYGKGPDGKEHLAHRFRLISGGTALEETMLPGSEEMVSI